MKNLIPLENKPSDLKSHQTEILGPCQIQRYRPIYKSSEIQVLLESGQITHDEELVDFFNELTQP